MNIVSCLCYRIHAKSIPTSAKIIPRWRKKFVVANQPVEVIKTTKFKTTRNIPIRGRRPLRVERKLEILPI
jgi:hypothetical protein